MWVHIPIPSVRISYNILFHSTHVVTKREIYKLYSARELNFVDMVAARCSNSDEYEYTNEYITIPFMY